MTSSRSGSTPTVLSIAGSDSGGGAGIQADLKAFARCGVHGATAITAITAQNTLGVSAIHAVPPEIILAQVRAVVKDIGVDAVKVGMLGTVEVTLAVARALDELPAGTPVVVDPVMVTESGARLLHLDAQQALIEELLPRATVLTPNLPEARVLVGRTADSPGDGRDAQRTAPAVDGRPESSSGRTASASPSSRENAEAEELIRAVIALGPRSVVLTGGHRTEALDLFLDDAGEGPVVSIPESATPTARRTDPGAPTPRCSPPSSRWVARRSRPRGSLARSPGRRSRGGCAAWARARAPSTCWTSPRCAPGEEGAAPVCHNPLTMKLLRLNPGRR